MIEETLKKLYETREEWRKCSQDSPEHLLDLETKISANLSFLHSYLAQNYVTHNDSYMSLTKFRTTEMIRLKKESEKFIKNQAEIQVDYDSLEKIMDELRESSNIQRLKTEINGFKECLVAIRSRLRWLQMEYTEKQHYKQIT